MGSNFNLLKLRNILNIIFMLGALVGLLVYFYSNHEVGIYIILGAISVKFVECALRIIK